VACVLCGLIQYSGTAGRIENCQLAVFLAYASPHGRTLVDRELYLPQKWCADAERRVEAVIPTHIGFATKPVLTQTMPQRALDLGHLPARWVTADEACGQDSKFRLWLQQHRLAYVLAVPCNQKIPTEGGAARADTLAANAPTAAWKRRSCGDGARPGWLSSIKDAGGAP
jgi:SRSO17 transposase